MKKGRKSLLSLVLVFPFLTAFSYTAALEEIVPSKAYYGDVEITSEYLGFSDNCQQHKVTIKNTGSKYALLPDYVHGMQNGHSIYASPQWELFYDEVIPAGETKSYVYLTQTEDSFDIETLTWDFYTYDLLAEEVTVSDCFFEASGNNYCLLKGSISGIGEYVYNAIIDVTYDEVHYAFDRKIMKSGESEETSRSIASFSAAKEFDSTKLTLNSVTVYRSSEPDHDPDNGFWWFGLFIVVADLLPYIIVGIGGVISAIVLIIGIIVYLHERKKRKNTQERDSLRNP